MINSRSFMLAVAVFTALTLSAPFGFAGAEDRVPRKERFGEPLPFQAEEEILDFLLTADITAVEELDVGITDPRRVELVKDGITVRAVVRDFDETFERMRFDRDFYPRLRDSYIFDLAAYELAKHFGLSNIPPVVRRSVNGVDATMQIWVEDALVEWDRFEDAITPPDLMDFQMQRQNMVVFDSVIGNVDRNNGNILYDANWNYLLIDHSRAFLHGADKMPYIDQINWSSRYMYERLVELDEEILADLVSPVLGSEEIDGVLARRDKVVARLDQLIEERGVEKVLF